MKAYLDLINSALDEYLEIQYPSEIYEAMRYSVLNGGKRVRPLLTLFSCEAFGGDIHDALPFACSLEMIHAYSLIHDDLPAMDNDDFRRGKPTNHKVFGEAMAILAGDALLNTAYEIMAGYCAQKKEIKFIYAMEAVASYAGNKGMIGGQVMDIVSEGKEIDAELLEYIHRNKTAALIKAAVCSGAYAAGAENDIVEKLKLSADYLGIAFQIKDDLLDIQSTEEVLGKPIHSDEKNHKATYVKIHGIEKAQKDYIEYSQKAIEILKEAGAEKTNLCTYAASLLNRTY